MNERPAAPSSASLTQRYHQVRQFTEQLVAELSPEDCMIQAMPDTSPTRWHLAHTTWFFETFVLRANPKYVPYDESFNYLFNSYYNTVGAQFPRPERGCISRPGLAEIKKYRQYVDEALVNQSEESQLSAEQCTTIELGLHHEQQHQELILTDIKYALSVNPCFPKYSERPMAPSNSATGGWTGCDERIVEVGYEGSGFAYDNESPRHRVLLAAHELSNQLVTCGDYLEFMQSGGYRQPQHWLSMGWQCVNEQRWQSPLYWLQKDNQWFQFTLAGLHPINPQWPVTHVSYFEADAFARWAGARLPTEFEWEHAASEHATRIPTGQFCDTLLREGHAIHPTGNSVEHSQGIQGLLGGVWEWTSSSYAPYPGYAPPPGAIGEYNGKFMCNQYVLRGGSVATPSSHIRKSYRNFFPPDARWQFSGIRLARSIAKV